MRAHAYPSHRHAGCVHVLVIGAGAWGCSIAHHLALAGEKVTLVDKGGLASGSSSKAAGVVSPLLWSETDVALVRRSYRWFDERCCQGDVHLHHPGEVKLVRDESAVAGIEAHVAAWRAMDVPAELMSPAQLRERFPALETTGIAAAVFTPEAGFLDPYQAATQMVLAAKGHGLVVRQGLAVTGFHRNGGKITAAVTEAGEIAADVVVLAAGTWTGKVAAMLGIRLPLKPYRAQALVTTPLPPQKIPVVHDASTGTYFFQEEGGGILAGDGTQEREFDPDAFGTEADFDFVSEVTARVSSMLPAASGASFVRGWAGLCGATPDREPLVGFHREASNLFIACGDNGFGFMRSPALGECAAAVIRGETPPIRLDSFDVNRFRGDEEFAIHQGYTLGT